MLAWLLTTSKGAVAPAVCSLLALRAAVSGRQRVQPFYQVGSLQARAPFIGEREIDEFAYLFAILQPRASPSFVRIAAASTMSKSKLRSLKDSRQSNVIKIASGPVRGMTYAYDDGKEASAFLGIPYAQPPIGELRFKASFLLFRSTQFFCMFRSHSKPNLGQKFASVRSLAPRVRIRLWCQIQI